MNDPVGRFLPDGDLEFDFGPGSCLSCGGNVTTTHVPFKDETLAAGVGTTPIDVCVRCGRVDYVVFHRDDGAILQGFMSKAELANLSELKDDPDAEVLF